MDNNWVEKIKKLFKSFFKKAGEGAAEEVGKQAVEELVDGGEDQSGPAPGTPYDGFDPAGVDEAGSATVLVGDEEYQDAHYFVDHDTNATFYDVDGNGTIEFAIVGFGSLMGVDEGADGSFEAFYPYD